MLSIILSVFCKRRPVCIQTALVISYYKCVVIEGTAPGVGQGKELSLSAEDGVHPNPIARGLAQTACDPLHIQQAHLPDITHASSRGQAAVRYEC